MNKKVLFVVGPALGHVARSLVVARALASQVNLNIVFAGVQRGHGRELISETFTYYGLPDKDDDCIIYADALERLMDRLSPDLICLDLTPFPWLLQVRFPKTLQVYLTNFFLTQPFLYTTYQEFYFRESALQVNRTRASRGLPPISNIKQMYDRDSVIFCDPLMLIDSADTLPPKYRVSGPCIWEPDLQLPDQLKDLNDILFISFGSTGLKPLQQRFAEEIADALNIKEIIWLGSKNEQKCIVSGQIKHHFYSWLPASSILRKSKFVITQGGAGSTYQAWANGKPVGIWPSHQNQEILGSIAQDFGSGMLLEDVPGMSQLIANNHDSMMACSKTLARRLSVIDGPMNAAIVIAKML